MSCLRFGMIVVQGTALNRVRCLAYSWIILIILSLGFYILNLAIFFYTKLLLMNHEKAANRVYSSYFYIYNLRFLFASPEKHPYLLIKGVNHSRIYVFKYLFDLLVSILSLVVKGCRRSMMNLKTLYIGHYLSPPWLPPYTSLEINTFVISLNRESTKNGLLFLHIYFILCLKM